MSPTHALSGAPTDGRLTLATLGRALLFYDAPGRPPKPVLSPGKPLALFTYLACCPGRAAGREHLVDLLWADAERGRQSLRQAVMTIRQRLGDDAISSDQDLLTL